MPDDNSVHLTFKYNIPVADMREAAWSPAGRAELQAKVLRWTLDMLDPFIEEFRPARIRPPAPAAPEPPPDPGDECLACQ